ncbi:hypothetical protein [Streptomyces sp. NPDC048191]|uniref:hypothetical protein n=1 Tax=Streptomyces sp. NPDC048191 TaxID=3155484 RepID=UPI0033DA1298
MRMKSRPYLHYAPVPGGVYFSGPAGQFAMRGPDLLFTIADVCVPLLETGATEDDLVRALGTEKARPAVRKVVEGLRGHDMLLDTERFTVPEPAADVRARFPEALAHLEAFTDDPYAAFAALRAAKAVLHGPPDVIAPAARGLARAGVGHLVLAPPDGDPAGVRAVAERLGARIAQDRADLDRAVAEADAVLWCPDEDGRAPWDGRPRPDAWLIPVGLGDTAVVGPPLASGRAAALWPALLERVRSGPEAQERGPVPRPGADALAGALGGQLVFEALTGCAVPEEAHVVHGDDLAADRVLVPAVQSPPQAHVAHTLDAAPLRPGPDEETALEQAYRFTAPWTGPLRLVTDDALPQMPLGLRQVAYRCGRPGSVVGWGAGQRAATVAAVLDALRGLCAGTGTGAAGHTREQWLLDGALRLLVARARLPRPVAPDTLPAGDRMLLRRLTDVAPGPVELDDLEVDGVGWQLARAAGADGEVLGAGWGRDRDEARHAALGTALARAQTRSLLPDAVTRRTDTAALLVAAPAELEALRAGILAHAAAQGIRYRGVPHRSDQVLGELPCWYGTVEAGPEGDTHDA